MEFKRFILTVVMQVLFTSVVSVIATSHNILNEPRNRVRRKFVRRKELA